MNREEKIKNNVSIIVIIVIASISLIAIVGSIIFAFVINKNHNENVKDSVNVDFATIYSQYVTSDILNEMNYRLPNGGNVSVESVNLCDIDKDGVEELLVTSGSCMADMKTYCYTFDKGEIVKIGEFNSGHRAMYESTKEPGLVLHLYQMETESVTMIKKNGNEIVEVEIIPLRDAPVMAELENVKQLVELKKNMF